MKYSIMGDELVLSQVAEGYDALAATGLYRWNRRDKTMRATVSIESITALENIFHRLPEPLQILRRQLQRLPEPVPAHAHGGADGPDEVHGGSQCRPCQGTG